MAEWQIKPLATSRLSDISIESLTLQLKEGFAKVSFNFSSSWSVSVAHSVLIFGCLDGMDLFGGGNHITITFFVFNDGFPYHITTQITERLGTAVNYISYISSFRQVFSSRLFSKKFL